jgi:uncharacterized membrane protein
VPGHSSIVTLVAPLVLVALAIPMILKKIPRNHFYGFRTPYTMSSDQVWYRANRIGGIALLVAGGFWLAMGLLIPNVTGPSREALRLVGFLGAGSAILSCIVSFWLTYKN